MNATTSYAKNAVHLKPLEGEIIIIQENISNVILDMPNLKSIIEYYDNNLMVILFMSITIIFSMEVSNV